MLTDKKKNNNTKCVKYNNKTTVIALAMVFNISLHLKRKES